MLRPPRSNSIPENNVFVFRPGQGTVVVSQVSSIRENGISSASFGSLRSRCNVSFGAVDRASFRWQIVARRPQRCGLRRVGPRFLRLRLLRPLSADGSACRGNRAAVRGARCFRAIGGRRPVYAGPSKYHAAVADLAFVGINAGESGCWPASRADRSLDPVRADRATRGATLRAASTFAAWRIVTPEDQWKRFVEDVPAHEPPVLSRIQLRRLGAALPR